ncbi:DUF397 domain-containing protein [Streptomyces sp. WY228]|nr:DUF397 domain-containing protein [Streptomyces sp. WY228]
METTRSAPRSAGPPTGTGEGGANLAATRGIAPVRDSKVMDSPVVAVPATAFSAFVAGVRGGTFDTV